MKIHTLSMTMREVHGCRTRVGEGIRPVDVMPGHAPMRRAQHLQHGRESTSSTVTSPPPSRRSADHIRFPLDDIEKADLLASRGTRPSPTWITHNHMHPTCIRHRPSLRIHHRHQTSPWPRVAAGERPRGVSVREVGGC